MMQITLMQNFCCIMFKRDARTGNTSCAGLNSSKYYSVCSFQSMKSPVELHNNLSLKFFCYTVLSPINGHSKKRTPLISGRIYFPRRNSGQTLIKNFLKSGQAISGPSV